MYSGAKPSIYANYDKGLTDKYDYIVCGAGSAGCVVAGRLAEDSDIRVLVLEAGGPDNTPNIDNLAWHENIYTSHVWDLVSEPEPGLNGRATLLPMGRVVGGGSSVNAFVYLRGHKLDYDEWAALTGDPKWSFENVLSVYKSIERWAGPDNPAYRGKNGKLWCEPTTDIHPAAVALKETGSAFGIQPVDDMNAEAMLMPNSIGHPNVILNGGKRSSLARDYLYPVLYKKNITVLTGAMVQQVLFDGDKAIGVEFVKGGERYVVEADREIVLSTGAVKTPHLLMLSGIGAEQELAQVGIKTRINLPGVGKNLQDHPLVASCVWEYHEPIAPRGTQSQCTAMLKVNSTVDAPDILSGQTQIPFLSEALMPRYPLPENGWSYVVGCAKPRSRGRVEIRSDDPSANPAVHCGFLSDPHDVQTLMRGVELTREIGNSKEMAAYAKREISPGPLSAHDLENFVRDGGWTFFHLSGSCKMGTDDMSVVDSDLRVRGVRNLRIADTSVFPTIPRCNTMAPAAMVGEQLVRMLLAS
jgi:choline dehydrogenase